MSSNLIGTKFPSFINPSNSFVRDPGKYFSFFEPFRTFPCQLFVMWCFLSTFCNFQGLFLAPPSLLLPLHRVLRDLISDRLRCDPLLYRHPYIGRDISTVLCTSSWICAFRDLIESLPFPHPPRLIVMALPRVFYLSGRQAQEIIRVNRGASWRSLVLLDSLGGEVRNLYAF